MATRELLAKKNEDGSYSVSYAAEDLLQDSFVDFYREKEGTGFQREETARAKRGRDIANYVQRCVQDDIPPKLFELTANARVGGPWAKGDNWRYEPLDDDGTLGILVLEVPDEGNWLSVTDGGTRLLGIENALIRNDIGEGTKFDVRIFVNLSLPQEIAQFLLINDYQKKVRTDLGLRVVQRILDEGKLSPDELKVLQTVVPETDSWKFGASRIAGRMNSDSDSPWQGRIQMPGTPANCTTLQSFFTSLSEILSDKDITAQLKDMADKGEILSDETEFVISVLKNFWNAIAEVNGKADEEPHTTVLWAPIGSSSCHIALAAVLRTVLDSPDPNLTKERFVQMMEGSPIGDYGFWFTKAGKSADYPYPSEKGDATKMTGAANYKRLGNELEESWRANLHARPEKRVVQI